MRAPVDADVVEDASTLATVCALAVVTLAVAVRLVHLDAPAVHWDEGVHAYYSWEFLATGEFTYEPWRHGPLLYFVSVPSMALLGESVVAGRAAVAVLSLGVFPALYLLRDEIPPAGLVFGAVVLAVHPYVVSTARFYRNDVVLATVALLGLGCYARYYRTERWYWAAGLGLTTGLAFATKEVAFLLVPAILLAILVVVHFAARFETGSLRAAVTTYLPLRPLPVALVAFVAVLAVLFGGWPPAPLDSLGRFVDGLAYWLSEGGEETGELTYYVARLGVGTPVLAALAVVGTVGTVVRPDAAWFRWLFVAWAGVLGLLLSLIGDQSWWNVVLVFVPMVLLAGYGLADVLAAGRATRATLARWRGSDPEGTPTRSAADGGVPVRSTVIALVVPSLAAALVLAIAIGVVPTPDAVGGVEQPNETALTDLEGLTVPDEPEPREEAFGYARTVARETGCPVVIGPAAYEWPAKWWVRGIDHERETAVDEIEYPAVVLTGAPNGTVEQRDYEARAFDGHRVYTPPGNCTG